MTERLKAAVAKAGELEAFRKRAWEELRTSTYAIEELTRELLKFSAAIDRKAAEELGEKGISVDARPLTAQEQLKASQMAAKVRELKQSAKMLAKVVSVEMENVTSGAEELPPAEQKKARQAVTDLGKLQEASAQLVSKASVIEQALSRARRRDDLKMILLKAAGIGALLALAATVSGLTVVGGILAIKALLAYGLSRVAEEAEKMGG